MLNGIWLFLVLSAASLGIATGRLPEVMQACFAACGDAVMKIALPLAGVMALWLGIMRLAEKSGAVALIARVLRPLLVRIFPDVPAAHPAMGAMVMNMAANMLGLANAATPLGLRAMQNLEKLNQRPGTASNAMCTFLALNTSSVQLIPATAVGILAANGSLAPTAIIGTALAATLCSTAVGLIAVKLLEKLPLYRLENLRTEESRNESSASDTAAEEAPQMPTLTWCRKFLLAFLLGIFVVAFIGMAFFPEQLAAFAGSVREFLGLAATAAGNGSALSATTIEMQHPLARTVGAFSLLAIPFFLVIFPSLAALRGVKVYEEFVEGAKEGFQVAVRIVPFLVAILAAVAMFRAAGGIDLLARLLSPLLAPLNCPSELVPLVFMRPLSGSGATGLFAELVTTHGADSLIARMAGTIMGSTETTFYVVAVYFGSVAIRRTRHAVPAGLLADLAGIVAAIAICNFVWG